MRFRYYLIRSASVLLMLALTLVSGMLALTISNFTGSGHVQYFPWPLFGDALVPLLLFFPALLFRSRLCAVGAIISSFINIFLRITSIIIYHEAFMPLNFQSIRLLLEHSGHYALRAVLGEFYYLWLIPLSVLVVSGVVYSCLVVWRTSRRKGRRLPILWSILFAVLLLLSAVSNLLYGMAVHRTDAQEFYTGHLVRPLPFISVDYANDAIHTMIPQSASGPGRMDDAAMKTLHELHMFAPRNPDATGELTAPPAAVFDKIIVIAVESLDLAYLRAVNPEMPEGITPNLDRWMTEFPALTNYFTASQPTSWALSSLLLSRVDYTRECRSREKNLSLFTIAATQGYFCAYFAPLSGIFGDNRKTYAEIFKPHVQYFLEEWSDRFGLSRSCTWGISDPELYDGVLKVLRQQRNSRLFAVISTMDSHPPYTASGITEADKLRFPTPFLQALHTTDRHLGNFVRTIMADRELYNERTLIVVTADHSATHGENYLKRPDFTPARIPLIFITPNLGIFRKLDRKKFASSIDLAPTLATWMGGVTPTSFMGRDLFSPKNLAFCWMHGDNIFVHAPDFHAEVDVNKVPATPREKAFCEFFRRYYPQ